MGRARAIAGIVSGVMILLSAAAHAFLGWAQLGRDLAEGALAPDAIGAVKVAWQFGGVAMLVFALVVLVTFGRRLAGDAVPIFPALLVGLGYLGFGTWALVISRFDPFFVVFLLPGALLVFASLGGSVPRRVEA